MTKNGQKWSFFYFLGQKMGQKICLAVFLSNVFEEPYKDAFIPKISQFASLIISTVTVTIRYRRYRENSRTVTKIQKNRYRQIGGR